MKRRGQVEAHTPMSNINIIFVGQEVVVFTKLSSPEYHWSCQCGMYWVKKVWVVLDSVAVSLLLFLLVVVVVVVVVMVVVVVVEVVVVLEGLILLLNNVRCFYYLRC